MATCPVRFIFNTELQGELKYVHNVPRSLVTPTAQVAQRDPEYVKNFVTTIQPIMQEHEAACRAASNSMPKLWFTHCQSPPDTHVVASYCGRAIRQCICPSCMQQEQVRDAVRSSNT